MKQNKNLLKGLLGISIMLVIIFALWMVYDQNKPETTKDSKEVVVAVVIPDEATTITLNTDAEYLGQALEEENLIKGTQGDYGLFITEVNKIAADETKQEWWCLTKDGVQVNTGADTTPIADGDHFEFTLTIGY